MDSKGSGINVIKEAYHFHCDDPEVVENICMLINEMVQYGKMVVLFIQSPPPALKDSKEKAAAWANGTYFQERLTIYLRKEEELELYIHPLLSCP